MDATRIRPCLGDVNGVGNMNCTLTSRTSHVRPTRRTLARPQVDVHVNARRIIHTWIRVAFADLCNDCFQLINSRLWHCVPVYGMGHVHA